MHMHSYRVAIVSIGDEVLNGDTLNTNAQWIATQCTRLGAHVVEQRTIPDSVSAITATLTSLNPSVELIITTGGLGPTHDDLTVAALAEFFGDELVEDISTLEYLHQYAAARGRNMTERLRKQALVPSSARVLPNRVGTAPGLLFARREGASVVVLPGVPREMEAIMTESVIPWLTEQIGTGGYSVVRERVLLTAGVPESELADRIEPIRSQLPAEVDIAFLPGAMTVRLRLRARGTVDSVEKTLDHATALLTPLLGTSLLSDRNERLVEVLQRRCIEQQKTLAVAESCTGGMLGAEITSVPGSSAYFLGGLICYSDAVKIHFGGVRPETLSTYGAVSQQTVEELSRYIRAAYGSDIAVAISGVAGPGGGTVEKPVGTVWIAVADRHGVQARKFLFTTDRQTNRTRACAAAILMVLERLQSD